MWWGWLVIRSQLCLHISELKWICITCMNVYAYLQVPVVYILMLTHINISYTYNKYLANQCRMKVESFCWIKIEPLTHDKHAYIYVCVCCMHMHTYILVFAYVRWHLATNYTGCPANEWNEMQLMHNLCWPYLFKKEKKERNMQIWFCPP